MSIRERVLSSRLSERISANSEYAERIGISAVMRKTNSFSRIDSTQSFNYKEEIKMTRKTRKDCTVGAFEKNHGLPAGTIRNKMVVIPEATKKSAPLEKSMGGKFNLTVCQNMKG